MEDYSKVFIISGPAGSGKDTIIAELKKLLPVTQVVNTTTRAPRPGEMNGRPYYFVSRVRFEQDIAENKFIEYSTNENGERYGVTRGELERAANSNNTVIWQMDWKGVIAVKKLFPQITAFFISAPLSVMENRLRERDMAKGEAYFQERLNYAREWLNHTDIYDYTIENEQDKLDEAVNKIITIIRQKTSLA